MGASFVARPGTAVEQPAEPSDGQLQLSDIQIQNGLKLDISIGVWRFVAEGTEDTVRAELSRFYSALASILTGEQAAAVLARAASTAPGSAAH